MPKKDSVWGDEFMSEDERRELLVEQERRQRGEFHRSGTCPKCHGAGGVNGSECPVCGWGAC